MTRRTDLPPPLSIEGFAIRDALAAGVNHSRMREKDLDAPFWGVRAGVGMADDLSGRARAYLSRSSTPAVVSHLSAAVMWGMPLPPHFENDARVHVSVPPNVRAPKAQGVAGHHVALHPMDVTRLLGVPITTQPRTLCDLAGYLKEEDLLAIADYLLWWRRDEDAQSSVSQISSSITRHPTKRGMARLRKVVPLATDRADSAPESKIRYRILDAGLPAPCVNLELFDHRGRFLAMPDLCYPAYMMSLDYEGKHHFTDGFQWEKDIQRVPRLEDAGWHHTRISKSDLRDSGELLARLSRNLKARGWNP